jgi:hypothetical protein
MHSMLVERSKKMRDGPGPNSYKQNDGDILEDFVRSIFPFPAQRSHRPALASSLKKTPDLYSSF